MTTKRKTEDGGGAADPWERIADAVARGERSVVRVDARRAPASGVAWSEDLLVTALHNLERDEPEVGHPDGRTAGAAVVGRDPALDLALLRVDGGGLRPPEWADPAGLRTGAVAPCVTRPGRAARASLGVIARLSDGVRTPGGASLDRLVEIDVPLRPGLSGGVALDAAGRAVGMLLAGLVPGAPLALPHPTLERAVKELLEHGGPRRGFLGIATVPVRLPAALARDVDAPGAILVSAVEPGSPAERGGIALGDAIVSVDGRPVASAADLLPLLDAERIGAALPVTLLRGGQRLSLSVEVGRRPAGGAR
jgi:S1-C subfamily serine protease